MLEKERSIKARSTRQLMVALALAVLTVACETDPAGTGIALIDVAIHPTRVTLVSGAVQQFETSGTYLDGTTLPIGAHFTVTGGTATASGLYAAPQEPGNYLVVAVARGGLADTALVAVTHPVSAVILTPDSTTVSPGAVLQFHASTLTPAGDTVNASLDFRATGGSINESGHFTAASTPGLFQVLATHTSTGLSDTSIVHVAAGAPPVARFTHSCTDLTCTFDGSTSEDVDGTMAAYNWDFGDGTGAGRVASHTFLTSGPHTVTLTVTDNDGHSASAVRSLDPTAGSPSHWIYPGDDAQATVSAHPAGTHFVIKAGLHRGFSVEPRATDVFSGEAGTILSGAKLLDSFTRTGGYWVASGQTQENPTFDYNVYGAEVCSDGSDGLVPVGPTCIYPEDLFIGDRLLVQVESLSAVGPGRWYFDYAADRIYMHDDPRGVRVEASVEWDAFHGSRAHDVVLQDLVVEKYANAGQHGALHFVGSDRVQIRNVEVRWTHGVGIRVAGGHGIRVTGNHSHHNGQLGIASYDNTDALFDDNEVAFNNTAGYSGFWEAGGMKLMRGLRTTAENNHVYRNNGKGIWLDLEGRDVLVASNTIDDNAQQGVFVEISHRAIVRNNTVRRNGYQGAWFHRAGIVVSSSPDVEVHDNVLSGNANGIIASQQDRGSGVYGALILRNLLVHNNSVTMTEGLTGVVRSDDVDLLVFTSRNNRFENNTYNLGAAPTFFRWNGQNLDEAGWQALGHDLGGAFNRP